MGSDKGHLISAGDAAVKHPTLDVCAAPSLPSLCLPDSYRDVSLIHLIKHLLAKHLRLVELERD